MKQVHNKQTLLAMGKSMIYKMPIQRGDFLYFFIGIISSDTNTVISCNNSEDMQYRYVTLQEAGEYLPGDDQVDSKKLRKMALERVKNSDHVHPNEIRELETA